MYVPLSGFTLRVIVRCTSHTRTYTAHRHAETGLVMRNMAPAYLQEAHTSIRRYRLLEAKTRFVRETKLCIDHPGSDAPGHKGRSHNYT